jgi:hypothetical protein
MTVDGFVREIMLISHRFGAVNRVYNSYSYNKLDRYVALRYIEFVSSNLLLKILDSARAARSAGFFLPGDVKVWAGLFLVAKWACIDVCR